MRALIVGLSLLVAACGTRPLPPETVAMERSQLLPMATTQCQAMGFAGDTRPDEAFCVDAYISQEMERRHAWQRMQASGVNHLGTEQMQAISQCVMQGMTPRDARMLGCVTAGTQLAIQGQNLRANEQYERAAAASRPVVCNTIGTTVICN